VNLTILNGNINASSSDSGAGIGAGTETGENGGRSIVENLRLIGGNITAKGILAGIGSGGEGGDVKTLTFAGSRLRITCAANEPKFPINASSIVLSNPSVIFETPAGRLFGVNPKQIDSINLTILFRTPTSDFGESLSGLNATLLQIGTLSPTLSGDWTLCSISISDSDSGDGSDHCIAIRPSGLTSLIVTLGSRGSHSVSASNATVTGLLTTPGGLSSFDLNSDWSFIEEGDFQFAPRPTAAATILIVQTPTAEFTPALLSSFHPRPSFIFALGWFLFWGDEPLLD
jgi:hypothetical protein